MADIILLNGTSSSGKSTLAKMLQSHQSDVPYLHAGIDNYIFMLPRAYLNPPLWSQVFTYEYDGDVIAKIITGPLGHQLMAAMHRSIAALAGAGLNVIVDHVLLEPGWLVEMVGLYAGYRVYFIGVKCPLEITEQREKERKDRTLGQARAQYPVVHADKHYDFEVDTSAATPEACARQIWDFIQQNPSPQRFLQMAGAGTTPV